MRRLLITSMILVALSFGLPSVAMADSFTAGGVVYTFTNVGSDGSGGFLVDLTIDATAPTASGMLDHFSIQISDGTNNATNATITMLTGTTGWSVLGPGNANHCGTGNLPFLCSAGTALTITSGVNSGTYVFTFDVTGPMLGTPTAGDVQALQGQGGLAISQGIGIGGGPSVPEPSSLAFLALGLLGAPFLRRKK